MNSTNIIEKLNQNFPGKNIVMNSDSNPTELICETEPGKEKSVAIAVVDEIPKHYRTKTTEAYEVIRGELELYVYNKQTVLKAGDKKTIKPGKVHWGFGKETWFKVTSTPGWTPDDHILVN